MVIELSGVQFGLKSYAWFQNRTSAQCEFDLKSQVWFQTKLHSTQFNYHYLSHRSIYQYSCVSFIVRILKPRRLKEDRPVTTFSEKRKILNFFWKRTKIIQGSTVQRLKTFKPLNLSDSSRNISEINECYWAVCVVCLYKNLRTFCFQKVFPVIFIYIY